MSTYVIGDIQGCFTALQRLLEHIQFDADKDTLWFTGDLVNRGPESLETLRFIKNLGAKHKTVLGNHDLHLLALSYAAHHGYPDDTLSPILKAKDRDELIEWLRQQPLLYHDKTFETVLVHAGLAFNWDLTTAKKCAEEVETLLRSDHCIDFFHHMYGNLPDYWSDALTGFDRLRSITNHFTRIRFCHPDGRIELRNKGKVENAGELLPWFKVPHRINQNIKIIFGHWAALGGITNTPNTYALDTGCIWGYALTAMRLEDEKRFSVGCAVS